MSRIAGLSYGNSIAYPYRTQFKIVPRHDMLQVVLEFVHPGNLGALPPSPERLASKGEQIGLAKFGEFFTEVWY